MSIRKKLPITGTVEDLYISALMKIYIITSDQNENLELSKDKVKIKESLIKALNFANEKINEYNNCIHKHLPLCEDLVELLNFADEYIQSKQNTEIQEVEKHTEIA
jgi:hypothetical protein